MTGIYHGWTQSISEEELRKNEIESVTKLLEQNPNNPYWQSRYNELVIKPMYGEDWEADAEAVHKLLTVTTHDVPHPVEEVKSQYECENCVAGVVHTFIKGMMINMTCKCCDGTWQDCLNCKPEGTGNDNESDIRADMIGHL